MEFFKAAQFHPFCSLFAIEILAIAVRSNDNIKRLRVGNTEKKINLLADDTTCIYKGIWDLSKHFFSILDKFASFSSRID